MTALAPMRREHFAAFAERSAARYAHENIASFRWQQAAALERAREHFDKLLPQGIDTPDQHLCEILDRPGGNPIGDLWFEITPATGARVAYLYDLYLDADSGEGIRAVLQALEARCHELGAISLGLHVFAHDAVAQALYVSLGFSVTGFNMVKRLDDA